MSKKSGVQSKSKKKLKVEDSKIPDYWLNELAGLEINENNWYCHVSIVVESDPNTSVFIEHFNEACQDGLRKEIQVISKYEILRTVTLNFFSKENTKKTPFAVLCDEIYKCLGPNNDRIIPTDMVAALIKYLILQYKDFNIKRCKDILISNETNVEALHKEICDKLEALAISTDLTKGSDKLTSKAKSKITHNKSTDIKTAKTKKGEETVKPKDPKVKATSKLRRRGEEWKDKKWIDDAPEGGPQLYIVISTLYLPDLPQELLKLNVPLNSIVKINLSPNDKDYNFYSISNVTNLHMQEELTTRLKEFRQQSAPYLKTAIKQHFTEEELNLIESKLNIKKFWKQLQYIIYANENILQFKDIMFIQFTPDITKLDFEQVSFQGSIYNQISFLLYQLFDYTEYHRQYLAKMKIIDTSDNVACSLKDKRLYKTMLDSVPSEFVNIPFILHAVLCQVEEMCNTSMTNELSEVVPQDKYTSENINIIKLKSLLHDLNNKNNLFCSENKQDLLQSSEVKSTKILSQLNKIELKTFNCKEIGPYIEDITRRMLLTTWKYILSSHCTNDSIETLSVIYKEAISECEKCSYDSSNLIYYFLLVLLDKEIDDNVFSPKESFLQIIDEYLHSWINQSTESLGSKNGDSIFKENNSFYNSKCLIYSENGEDNISSKTKDSTEFYLSKGLPAIKKKLFLKEYKYFEDLCVSDMLQLIQESYFKSNTLQYRCFPCTDQKLLFIYNTLSSSTNFNECYQMTKLRSEVGLRDFVEFILNEEALWIHKLLDSSENNIVFNTQHFKNTKIHSISDLKKDFEVNLCEDSVFISRNSLKHITQPAALTEVELKSPKHSKKSKSATKEKSKKSMEIKKKEEGKKSIKDDAEEVKTDTEALHKTHDFLGYDLGPPVRIQFSTFTREIFLPHDCKLTINTLKRLYKSESVSICVAKHGNELYYHNDKENKSGSFHIYHESGEIIHFYKAVTDVTKKLSLLDVDHCEPNVTFNRTDYISAEIDEISRKSETKQTYFSEKIFLKTELDKLVTRDDFETHSKYNVSLSLPSGLLINIVNDVPGVFHIKQNYLIKRPMYSKIADENYRCLLKNGTVIKYLNNGVVEILCPNSTICRYREFEWINEIKDIIEDTDEVKQTIGKQTKFESRKSIKGTQKQKKVPQSDKSESEKRTADEPIVSEGKYQPVHYDITYSDGKQRTFKDNVVTFGDTLFILETNTINEGIRNVERLDNTELQYFSDGSLLVNFYDGTRITSTVIEDENELFCDWSESDYLLWFTEKSVDKSINSFHTDFTTTGNTKSVSDNTNKSKSSKQPSLRSYTSMKKSIKSNNKTIKSELDSGLDTGNTIEMKVIKTPVLKDDGYIVINMRYTIEHPNYATVTYDYNNFHLKLPTDISVTLSPLCEYMIQLGSKATLTTDRNEIIFNHIDDNNSEILLNTVIYPETFVDTDTLIDALCISKDNLGNKIIISREGDMYQQSGLKFLNSAYKGIEGLNCFVLRHDFSGFKFLHETEIFKHNETVMNCGGLNKKYANILNTNFTSIPILSSELEKWVSSYQKSIPVREMHLPSTFSDHNAYLFPFRTKKPSPCDHTELPNTLAIRLIHKFPPLNKDIINCCLRAFNSVDIQNTSTYSRLRLPLHSPKMTDFNVSVIKNNPELIISIYEESRKQCENKATIDLLREKEIYNLLHKVLYTVQKLHENENVEFMRHSLRERIVPPYFNSPMGQSYDLLFNIINTVVWMEKNSKEISCDSFSTLCEKMSSSVYKNSVKCEQSSDDLRTLCKEMTLSKFEQIIEHQDCDCDELTIFYIPYENV